ncbi:MAG: metal-dependent transcriptional regulator [Anaerolineae bacterium]|nr:metal-dependent transcriptional regulator [Anaerolineae bacterium]
MPDPLIALLFCTVLLGGAAAVFWPDRGLLATWQRSRHATERVLIEDALKYIHKRSMEDYFPSLDSISGALQITGDRTTNLLKKMQEINLLQTEPDGRLKLTPDGRDYALQIIRAHRLWERYLADETGYQETDWHIQAERQEHLLTPNELDALSAQLGHPVHDPHGDPIPTVDGQFQPHHGQPLIAVPVDKPFVIAHLEDEPETTYAQLIAEGFYPGMEGRVIESLPQRIRLWAGGDEHVLAPIVAKNVSVILLPEEQPLTVTETCKRLSSLQPGQTARVVSLSPAMRRADRHRLMDLGIVRDTEITTKYSKGPGNITAYRVRGALIALRSEQADLIHIQCTDAS